MKTKDARFAGTALTFTFLGLSLLALARQGVAESGPSSLDAIPPMRERVEIMERAWRWKKEHVLPEVMRELGVDLWILRSDEGELFFNDESPVFVSLLQANIEGLALPSRHVRPGSQRIPRFLLFHDTGSGIEYFEPEKYGDISATVERLDPKRIAMADFANGPMLEALGPKFATRAVSSWTLGVRWLETVSADQISVYRLVQRVASEVIAEGFSNRVIVPDITTTGDLNWWFRHRMLELGLEHENHPSIGIQRSPANIAKYADPAEFFEHGRTDNDMDVTIRRGDIVSCDTDIMLLGLVTDSHQHAYVLEEGETDVPVGLKDALLKVNQVQDQLAAEFRIGRSGKEIVAAAEKLTFEEGVLKVDFAFHPPPMFIRRFLLGGFFFTTKPYVAGMTSGPGYYPTSIVTNDHHLHHFTLYAFEPHTRIAVEGWGPDGVELGLGQIVAFTPDGFRYLARAQESKWHVIGPEAPAISAIDLGLTHTRIEVEDGLRDEYDLRLSVTTTAKPEMAIQTLTMETPNGTTLKVHVDDVAMMDQIDPDFGIEIIRGFESVDGEGQWTLAAIASLDPELFGDGIYTFTADYGAGTDIVELWYGEPGTGDPLPFLPNSGFTSPDLGSPLTSPLTLTWTAVPKADYAAVFMAPAEGGEEKEQVMAPTDTSFGPHDYSPGMWGFELAIGVERQGTIDGVTYRISKGTVVTLDREVK